MTCGTCGATIADKAIVCYRCGAPTAAPVSHAARPPAPRRSRAGAQVLLVIGVLLLAVGLILPMDAGTGRDVVRLSGLALTIIGAIRTLRRQR
jgi:hypothetical protein